MIPLPFKECAFNFGDIVYHKTDGDAPGLVTGIVLRPGIVLYEVMWQGRIYEIHAEIELTTTPPKFSASEPAERLPD